MNDWFPLILSISFFNFCAVSIFSANFSMACVAQEWLQQTVLCTQETTACSYQEQCEGLRRELAGLYLTILF